MFLSRATMPPEEPWTKLALLLNQEVSAVVTAMRQNSRWAMIPTRYTVRSHSLPCVLESCVMFSECFRAAFALQGVAGCLLRHKFLKDERIGAHSSLVKRITVVVRRCTGILKLPFMQHSRRSTGAQCATTHEVFGIKMYDVLQRAQDDDMNDDPLLDDFKILRRRAFQWQGMC